MFSAAKSAAPSGGYTVGRSLRFRASASAYLNRTPASAGSQTTWTWSGWVKRGSLGGTMALCQAGSSTANETMIMLDSDNFRLYNDAASATNMNLVSTAVYRDPSAWYHFVVAYNSTQATSTNRVSMYVNGVQITSFSTSTYPAQNQTTVWNSAVAHAIGERRPSADLIFDGYLAEVNFIDGQALTPTSFGAYDTNGVWQPIKYTGTYGTNGFYLPFSDNSAATPANLGKDFSGTSSNVIVGSSTNASTTLTVVSISGISVGNIVTGPGIPNNTYVTAIGALQVTLSQAATSTNVSQNYTFSGNNWTPNNISLTAGSPSYDSMIDSPTNSASSSNYPVMNVLSTYSSVPSNGNLALSVSNNTGGGIVSTMALPTTGKWYWEITAGLTSGGTNTNGPYIGIVPSSYNPKTGSAGSQPSNGYLYLGDGTKNVTGTVSSYGSTWTDSTSNVYTIGVAYDAGAGTIVMYRNNVSQGTLASGISGEYIAVSGNAQGGAGSCSLIYNFGQQGFFYTPPTGYSALNTYNLPTPTIKNGALYMAASTYTGNQTNPRSITNGGNNTLGKTFYPDLTWIKSRTYAYDHNLWDSVRGAGSTKNLSSDSTQPENGSISAATYGYVSAFNSDGFTVVPGSGGSGAAPNGYAYVNQNSTDYVAWQWLAGAGSSSSNTSGSITSTVSANTTAGFSIVTYTGNGTAGATVGHGLGVAPSMFVLKSRSSAQDWNLYHVSLGPTVSLELNLTLGSAGTSNFNSTSPTSSVFSVGSGGGSNANGTTYVAYCFAAVKGYSAFGSYTGNGSTDGPFVFTGFRPRWVLFKRTDAIDSWYIYDTSRNTYNVMNNLLIANLSNAESTAAVVDYLSNGFKLRDSGGGFNASGGTYIYAAFAENPFNYSRAR